MIDPNASRILKFKRSQTRGLDEFLGKLGGVAALDSSSPEVAKFFDDAISLARNAISPGVGLVIAAATLGAARDRYTAKRCMDFLRNDSAITGHTELLDGLNELDIQAAINRDQHLPASRANAQLSQQVGEISRHVPEAIGSFTLLAYVTGAIAGTNEQNATIIELHQAVIAYVALAESQDSSQGQ